jgi:low temperature requirement protein LtrA
VWLVSALVPPPFRFGLWAVGLALEFYVTLSPRSRRLQYLLPPDIPHFAERYGLFTIIVLGESFIKVVGGLAGRGIGIDALVLSGLGFAVAACVWWLYFDHTHGAVVRSTPAARYVWIYGHLPLMIGITGLGVGLKKLALLPLGEPASDTVRWLFGGAVALCLVALALLESVKVATGAGALAPELAARLVGAAAIAGVAAIGGGLPAGAFALLVALTCAAVVAIVGRLAPAPQPVHP